MTDRMPKDPFASITNSFALEGARPSPHAHSSKSFSRYEPSMPVTATRSRESTLQNEVLSSVRNPEQMGSDIMPNGELTREGDVFEKRSSEDGKGGSKPASSSPLVVGLPDGFDELPIELVSLTDR